MRQRTECTWVVSNRNLSHRKRQPKELRQAAVVQAVQAVMPIIVTTAAAPREIPVHRAVAPLLTLPAAHPAAHLVAEGGLMKESHMHERFHLERVDIEDPADENRVSGYGMLELFQSEVEYRFNTEDIRLEEAEGYIQNVLNRLPDETVNDICNRAYEWKTEKMSSDTVDYPAGLAEVEGRGFSRSWRLAKLNFIGIQLIRMIRSWEPY
ncbi:hypothetical protein N6H13_08320 [Paenibacillus sp. CC-CFT742]|nr:hypothetical protein [Paenibacillus sp. CC-CFT742]WJH30620.1 hypothetical protein N6H13_08320 [Paenibacillus sp. CC-CFT742]